MIPALEECRTDAVFSPCERYRYTLERIWDAEKPFANFICLNPSTATALKDDPTNRRCRGFAWDWDMGGMITTNVFGWRSTDPKGLKDPQDPVGTDNDRWILEIAGRAGVVVVAWGNHARLGARSQAVARLLLGGGIAAHALAVNANGEPKHPLYLRSELRPQAFDLERLAHI
ncbi:MAG: DUF1643 domain-containing protein [bacterium]